MKRVIYIITVVIIGMGVFLYYDERKGVNEAKETLSNVARCNLGGDIYEIVDGDFHHVSKFTAAGEAIAQGYVVSRKEVIWNESVESIYLKISPVTGENPSAVFYSYFSSWVDGGNTVNAKDGADLLFKLGIFKKGDLLSTANISYLAKSKLISSMNKTDKISLLIKVPLFNGKGAPSHFTPACSIILSSQ